MWNLVSLEMYVAPESLGGVETAHLEMSPLADN